MITLNVGELNHYLKTLCDSDELLHGLFLRGEVSNFTRHRSGHLYFSLKEGDSSIRCVMFARQAATLRFPIADGVRVLCGGRVSVYERDGSCQFYAERISPDGEGAAKAALQQLYQKLSAEGLFLEERKLPLPAFAQKVAVITSSSGAALIDVCAVWKRKWPAADLILFPATVQGARAVPEICAALQKITPQTADAVLLVRGGGAAEDLWVFNDETLVRAVARCPLPLISAIGHEVDYTLCDLAASARAATPTAAANLVFPDQEEVQEQINAALLGLQSGMKAILDGCSARTAAATALLQKNSPKNQLMLRAQALQNHTQTLEHNFQACLSAKQHRLMTAAATLEALSPLSTLLRGYAIVSDAGQIVTSAQQAAQKQSLNIRFSDGNVPVRVERKMPDASKKV